MDAIAIISAIGSVIKLAVDLTPSVIKTVDDAKPFAKAIYDDLVNKKVITHDDLLALEAKLTELSAQLQAPLPPEDDQDV
jgi:hypothetical protein